WPSVVVVAFNQATPKTGSDLPFSSTEIAACAFRVLSAKDSGCHWYSLMMVPSGVVAVLGQFSWAIARVVIILPSKTATSVKIFIWRSLFFTKSITTNFYFNLLPLDGRYNKRFAESITLAKY